MDQSIKKIFKLFIFIIIPLYTLGLASCGSYVTHSLSYVANYLDKQTSFIIWGIMIGIFFVCYLSYLFQITAYENKRAKRTMMAAGALMLLSVMTPYLPESYPLKSFLHIFFSFISPILMLISIYLFVINLIHQDKVVFQKAMYWLGGIVMISALMLVTFGIVNSLLEVFFTIAIGLFLFYLNQLIERKG